MSSQDAEAAVRALADHAATPISPQHWAETVESWRRMAPHLERVRAAALGPDVEPAALFHP